MGPKSNSKYPCKREAWEDQTYTDQSDCTRNKGMLITTQSWKSQETNYLLYLQKKSISPTDILVSALETTVELPVFRTVRE